MDTLDASPLQDWKLETVCDDKLRYHQRTSGDECWISEECIGSGSFGNVWRERCVSGPSRNALRAVKHLHRRRLKMSRRELDALVTFSDTKTTEYKQHFVQFLGWFDDKSFIYIAMEYLENGDLQRYIGAPLPEPQAASIVAQVARALHYMHHRQFVHRDIKPENILVSRRGPNWHVKVTDFGISKNTDGTGLGTLGIGTDGYMAPELLKDDSDHYTPAVDVWALGAVAFCLQTGNPPFPTRARLRAYANDPRVFPVEPLRTSSSYCMDFVRHTMQDIPERRSTIDYVLTHLWLSGSDAPESGKVVESSTNIENPFSPPPSNTWSNTYNSSDTSNLRSSSSTTPIIEPEEVYEDDSELMTQQTTLNPEDIGSKGSVLKVKLTILWAHDLEKIDLFRSPDPFVRFSLNGRYICSTSIQKRTRNPYWGEVVDIEINENSQLLFLVYDSKSRKSLGHAEFWPGKSETWNDDQPIRRFIGSSGNSDLHLSTFHFKLLRESNFGSISQDPSLPESNIHRDKDRRKDKARFSHNDREPTEMLDAPAAGKHFPEYQQERLHAIFGVSLEDLYARDGITVPFLLHQCFNAIEKFGLNSEGIYRHSGSATHIKKLTKTFETNASKVEFSNPENFSYDVHSVAGLVKQFFNKLPEPVIPRNQYTQFVNAARLQDDYERREAIRGHINVLPDAHYAVSRALFLHLEEFKKMSTQNDMSNEYLANSFGPILMRGRDITFQTRVITTILENVLHIFHHDYSKLPPGARKRIRH